MCIVYDVMYFPEKKKCYALFCFVKKKIYIYIWSHVRAINTGKNKCIRDAVLSGACKFKNVHFLYLGLNIFYYSITIITI